MQFIYVLEIMKLRRETKHLRNVLLTFARYASCNTCPFYKICTVDETSLDRLKDCYTFLMEGLGRGDNLSFSYKQKALSPYIIL